MLQDTLNQMENNRGRQEMELLVKACIPCTFQTTPMAFTLIPHTFKHDDFSAASPRCPQLWLAESQGQGVFQRARHLGVELRPR